MTYLDNAADYDVAHLGAVAAVHAAYRDQLVDPLHYTTHCGDELTIHHLRSMPPVVATPCFMERCAWF